MFPFGSGMNSNKNYNHKSSAPPMIQSNPNYPGTPKQIPLPFGAETNMMMNRATSNNNPTTSHTSPYPNHNNNSAPYPNQPFPNTTPYPNNHHHQQQQSFSNNNNQPQPNQFYGFNQPTNLYPNVNHSAPFSYTNPPQQQYRPQYRSTSDYMRQGTPTVFPKDDFNAQDDSALLRKAMKGFGCDDNGLIEVICHRNNQQRQEIQKVFKTNFGKDLIENIKSETRGNFEDLLVALLTPTLDYYCKEIYDACAGIGTDEDVLIEVLCTLSNNEINTIRDHYQTMYGKDLESVLIGETSGNFKRLLVSLVNANRDESGEIDIEKAKADATALLRAGELRFGTDESVFNAVLCQRNYAQLRLIFQEYQTMTGHSFEQAIKNEFSGTDSDVRDGLLAIVRCVNNKAEFFAHQLQKSMKGLGTNDRQLIRLIVTRCEIDMVEIKEAFERLFGESLRDCIKGDTSGSYKYALYELIGEKRSS